MALQLVLPTDVESAMYDQIISQLNRELIHSKERKVPF